MKLAVIPARGGSKRIPRKNIREFCGKPMIAYSIEAALESNLFDHVIVSTDDEEIASIARDYGAETPFMRPAELADDYADTTEVTGHAITWMQQQGREFEYVCCIYATAALLQEGDLKRGLVAMESGQWSFAFSVTEFASSIFRSFVRSPEGGIEMLFPERYDTRSQDLPTALHDAAQFYWGTPQAWLNAEQIFGRHSFPVYIPGWRVQDIDTEDDWRRAEIIQQLLAMETKK